MVSSLAHRIRRLAAFGRLMLVVLAVACQISTSVLAQPRATWAPARSALQAAMVFCQAGGHAGKNGAPPAHHSLAEPAIAGATAAFAQLVAVTSDAPFVPPPPAGRVVRTHLPEARGPPVRYAIAAYPTGPPFLF